MARICGKGLEMRMLAHDPYVSREDCEARGAEKVDDLNDLLRQNAA